MGGAQPPQLPTSPPTYESVSDRTIPLLIPLLVPADGQMDRAGHNSGKSSLLSLLKVSPLCSFFLQCCF